MSNSVPAFIIIDWGSSNFRAYLLDQQQNVLISIKINEGVKLHHGQDYAVILKQYLQSWEKIILEHKLPLIMAGMIGSNLGWYEVPYLSCPLPLQQLAQHLYVFTSPWQTKAYIVPGVKIDNQENTDVMRGEEVLILGAQQLVNTDICCLPGTHSKWAILSGNKLNTFSTLMTGELYATLLQHSLLGLDLPKQKHDKVWFNNGVMSARENGEILTQLFQVRAKRLLKRLPTTAVASYLSGLLIGNEVNTMLSYLQTNVRAVTMVATSKQLNDAYQQVFNLFATTVKIIDGEQAFLQGIKTIIRDMT